MDSVTTENDSVHSVGGLHIDTVEMLGKHELRPEAAKELLAHWEAVQVMAESSSDRDVWCVMAGQRYALAMSSTVRTSARGAPFPLLIACGRWRLLVHPWKGSAKLILSAEALASESRADLAREAERVGWWLWGDVEAPWKVSRIDVAADVVGLPLESLADLRWAVRRSRGATVHSETDEGEEVATGDTEASGETDTVARVSFASRTITGITLGSASSRVQVCVYDKVREAKAHKKTWVPEWLKARGWDGESPVTRVEYRFRARALEEFYSPDGTRYDLRCLATVMAGEWVAPCWGYATSEVVRWCVPSEEDSNRSRWEMRSDWKEVSSLVEVSAHRLRAVPEAVAEERRKRASAAIVRGAVALAAESGASADRVLGALAEASARATEAAAEGRTLPAEEAPEIVLVALALATFGTSLGARALGMSDPVERSNELARRVRKKREAVAWTENIGRYFYPMEEAVMHG